ncbi:T9SS type B sorting domain-containing protein [Tenacibaculum amylolyticum]|uniref:T9SS type B sorting domain-containing protein n=1 Tax=Tenacibaculum amylolyticum TaxID=104269 RepID=UPI003895FEAA
MRKQILIVFIFVSIAAFSQKQANVWYFGQNAGIDFNTSPPTALTDGQLNTDEGCSSFSDQDGNLLFYTDGITIYAKDHSVMLYTDGTPGNNLKGNPTSTQSGMIIPKPGSDTIYYLFTVGTDFVPPGILPNPGFNYYTIDMAQRGGLGEIIDGPVNLAIDPDTGTDISQFWSEKVAAVKAQECNAFWVISFVQNTFYAYKVTTAGVDTINVVKSNANFTAVDKRGYLQASPDGRYLAFADFNANGSLRLFEFDNATGQVNGTSSQVLFSSNVTGESVYGIAFSQLSNNLYASTFDGLNATFNIHQFDLTSTNIPASINPVISKRGFFRGGLQLGPDGKIYASIPGNSFLDIIENPNENNAQLIYTEDAIDLNGRIATQGLPPFISSLLLPINIIDNATSQVLNNQNIQYCRGTSVTISPETVSGTVSSYEWTFNNGTTTTTISNQPTLTLNNLTTNDNGTYTLIISLTDTCGNITRFEGLFNISVFEPATANPVSDINFCDIDGDGINTFDLQTDIAPIVLGSQDPSIFEVLFFDNLNDAQNNIIANAIASPYTNTIPFINQDIYVRINNRSAPNACYDLTQFNLAITGLPVPSQPTNYSVCDDVANGGDTDGFFNNFILATKDSEILGSLSPTQYNVSYHTTLTGAQTDNTTDVIDKNTPYRNTTVNQQTIYVRIENVDNTNCNTVSDPISTTFQPFDLIVNSLPVIANNPAQINQCGTSVGSITTINLTQAQISISDNNANETFQYYPTENDAINDTAVITDPINYVTTNGDSVWVRTITNNGCYRISRLNITVSFAGDVAYNQEFTTCDDFLDADGNNSINNDDTDGIANFDLSSAIDDIKLLFDPSIRNDLDILLFESETDRNAVINQISDPTNYRNTALPASTQQTIFVKIINKINNDCTGLGEFFIRVLPLPEFEVTTPQIVCLNNPSFIEVEMPNGIYNYEWRRNGTLLTTSNSEQLNITQGGTYEVTAINTSTLCKRSKEIIVNESIIASIQDDDVTIVDDSPNNSITINNNANNLGIGDYEFALQNENSTIVRDFQDTPFFENLEGGVYTILVRDKNNCGIAQLEVSVLEFPKFFTPNGDGNNDVWNVKGASTTFYPKSSIHIFDRYGKIITEIAIDGVGWDGLYNGKTLPSSDYWFNIELTDNQGKTINRNGHFSLLRK